MPEICYVDYKKLDYDSLISPTLTGWGDKSIQMHYMDKKLFEINALKLLQELRMLSGINYRKYKASNKLKNNSVLVEFSYINKLIDDFVKNNNIKNFKK